MIASSPFVQNGRALLLSFGLIACATPQAELPTLTKESIEEGQRSVQQISVDDALAREERVLRLTWPIVEANAELCPKTAMDIGVRVGNAKTIRRLADGLTAQHIKDLGYTDKPFLLSVAPGSPAAAAGLQPGDQLKGIDDVISLKDMDDVRKVLKPALSKRKDDFDPLPIVLERQGETIETELIPVEVCDIRVVSSPKNEINATASFKEMTIYAGLLRALPDDQDVSFVIAHELAHIAGRHPRKGFRNAGTTGAIVWAGPLLLTSGLIDTLIAPPLEAAGVEAPPLSTASGKLAAASIGVTGFEREADYVGAYMLARAGGDLNEVDTVFETFAKISPRTTWLQVSHPNVTERLLRLEQARQEIAVKDMRGVPLIPEGWTIDQPAVDDVNRTQLR